MEHKPVTPPNTAPPFRLRHVQLNTAKATLSFSEDPTQGFATSLAFDTPALPTVTTVGTTISSALQALKDTLTQNPQTAPWANVL